jgi:hypothetical protein
VSPRRADLLTGAALAGLLALVSLTSPRWARFLRQPLAAVPVSAGEEAAGAPESAVAASAPEGPAPERRISVKLFFEEPERGGLVMEEREVPFASDLSRQIRAVLEQLIEGSRAGKLAPLAPDTKVIEVFVTAWGTAYVDLSKEATLGQVGGSKGELLAVYAVVNSITTNFPAVARVQILLDDRPATTLSGHVDLSRPLSPDMTLLAAVEPLPSPGAPAAAPSPAS